MSKASAIPKAHPKIRPKIVSLNVMKAAFHSKAWLSLKAIKTDAGDGSKYGGIPKNWYIPCHINNKLMIKIGMRK